MQDNLVAVLCEGAFKMPVNEANLLRLLPLLREVLAKVGLHRTRTGSDLDLTSLQTQALTTVLKKDSLTMGELAKDMFIVQSAATRIVDELVRKGLVKRADDRRDRRVTRLKITTKGREACDRAYRESYFLLAQVLERISPAEQEALIGGLGAFLNGVKAVEQEVFRKYDQDKRAQLAKSLDQETSTVVLSSDSRFSDTEFGAG